MKKILLIDTLNFLHRATIKFGGKTDEPDEVIFVFNFFRNFRALIEKFQPDKCYFVLEGHPKFRYDLLPEYKANRIIKTADKQEARDNFHKTKREVLRLLENLKVTIVKHPHFECDDVISTLAEEFKNEDVTIVSNDSDFIQLLQKGYENLKIYNSIKKEFMIAPEFPYTAAKSLAGDKTDNIPALLSKAKALKVISDPQKLSNFLDVEENRANFSINMELIEFKSVPMNEIEFRNYNSNFVNLKEEFVKANYQSLIKEEYWNKFVNTFKCLENV